MTARAIAVLSLFVATLPAIVATGAEARQEAPPAAEAKGDPNEPAGEKEGPPPPPLMPSEYAPGERPPPKEKTYDRKPSKLWPMILKALAEAGAPVESADEASGYIKTQLVDFDYTRFQNVATKPPLLTRERPIRQIVMLNQGRYSVEIQVGKAQHGSLVGVRAYIEERAYEIKYMRRVFAERISNGRIEDDILAKIDAAAK